MKITNSTQVVRTSKKNRATPHKKGLHEYMFLTPTLW